MNKVVSSTRFASCSVDTCLYVSYDDGERGERAENELEYASLRI